ncbi:hypothetical protein [Vibrio sp. WXL210]|uniref:hypothetical protein n=1 Tax=Vibrio sp. WXL210 TaxID=3450709 RepID=UPI003EC5170F
MPHQQQHFAQDIGQYNLSKGVKFHSGNDHDDIVLNDYASIKTLSNTSWLTNHTITSYMNQYGSSGKLSVWVEVSAGDPLTGARLPTQVHLCDSNVKLSACVEDPVSVLASANAHSIIHIDSLPNGYGYGPDCGPIRGPFTNPIDPIYPVPLGPMPYPVY